MEVGAENRFEALLLRSGNLALVCAHEGKEALRTEALVSGGIPPCTHALLLGSWLGLRVGCRPTSHKWVFR